MELTLIRPGPAYRDAICDMMDEWRAAGETIIPNAIARRDHHDFAAYLASLEHDGSVPGQVPESTFFCLDAARGRLVGAVSIRHRLNERLLLTAGHIGDGVRPSERGRGVATRMIALALAQCRALGIGRVLMVCKKDNPASARTIVKTAACWKTRSPPTARSGSATGSRWSERPHRFPFFPPGKSSAPPLRAADACAIMHRILLMEGVLHSIPARARITAAC